ncbi:MAG: Uma2 family endonuclease [Microcoleaceae cyanobacterium]
MSSQSVRDLELTPEASSEITYPESDGQLMADNTQQFRWIVIIKENLEILFANVENIFVAGDLLWYPTEGNNKNCQAPDAMVVFGRPKGDRGSYQQWKEDNIAPQVVFEIISPGNRAGQMAEKLLFYQRHAVEEYYLYNPQTFELTGLQRSEDWLRAIDEMSGWVSPRLEIRFELTETGLEIYRPDGQKFLTPVELDQFRQQETERAERERQRADQAELQLQQERQRAERLAELLRAQGISSEEI